MDNWRLESGRRSLHSILTHHDYRPIVTPCQTEQQTHPYQYQSFLITLYYAELD
jgi:hypothetical protein